MKKIVYLLFIAPVIANAQLPVTFQIHPQEQNFPVSPYIYGSCNGGFGQATLRRIGGNRLTGYNWEINASNAGTDYFNQSDDYLPWAAGIPSSQYGVPAIVLTNFHNHSLQTGAVSAITLPMAGYVAADMNNTSVQSSEAAPSARWCQVVNHKPFAFSLSPDLNDGIVYVDECINYLQSQFGNSASQNGIRAYIMDNEPGLWTSTHPLLYTGSISAIDHLNKSVALAKTIRGMDAAAEIWGPESYGFYEYTSFQGAADWSNYPQYEFYLSAYLDSMRIASQQFGSRLLNTLSVHWYPDVNAGNVFSSDVSDNVVEARVQIPRTLWDSTYVEDGWIGQYYSSDLPILYKLKSLISTYYPGTKLGITEYDYGADAHISGGIAQAEALMGFIHTGTDYATKWGAFSDYSLSAIQLFTTVPHPFPAETAFSTSSDHDISDIVAGKSAGELHFVVTSKDDQAVQATFQVPQGMEYDSLFVYSFSALSPAIQTQTLPASSYSGNSFSYTLAPRSVYHFAFVSSQDLSVSNLAEQSLECYPNPSSDLVSVRWNSNVEGKLRITDISGQELYTQPVTALQNEAGISLTSFAPGTYLLQLVSSSGIATKRVVKQ